MIKFFFISIILFWLFNLFRPSKLDVFCVEVKDDGVGFDTATLLDDREHVGIRNIRGRLKAMVNGTLEIESAVGVGTKVLITIPKGEEK